MLEKVTFNKKPMKKAVYKEQWDELLAKLVVLQQQAHNEGVGLVVLFEGWNGAGKGSRISDLMYHLDARSTGVYVGLDLDPDTEREFVGRECGVTGFYPIMQPFWKALGERNSITFYDRGWYTAVIQHMLYNAPAKLLLPKKEERHYLDSVHDFEQQLVADGYVVVKFFVHMTKKAQVERLQRLHDDPVTRWRVTEKKLESHHGYETAYELYDRLLERSDYDFAPWVLLNGEDKRRTNLTIRQHAGGRPGARTRPQGGRRRAEGVAGRPREGRCASRGRARRGRGRRCRGSRCGASAGDPAWTRPC